MNELPLLYVKELASQITLVSVFFGGISASLLAAWLRLKSDDKKIKVLVVATTLSAVSFMVAVVAMIQVIMIVTPGSPIKVDTDFSRVLGGLFFMLGMFSLLFVLSYAGWLHSRRVGMVTTVLGGIGALLMLMLTSY